jgi:1-acyl-sn-glycerol-3-phosphate acyltransferase
MQKPAMSMPATTSVVIRTIIVYFLALGVFVVTLPPITLLLLIAPLGKAKWHDKLLFSTIDLFYWGILWALQVPVTITGKENMPQEPAIIVANHQSSIDIMVLGVTLKRFPHVWYALTYYLKKPILGFFIRRLCLPLNRDGSSTSGPGFIRGLKLIQKSPYHIIIFPEGTRHIDGQVHEFLRGFVLLARETKRPLVPVYMPYNYLVYPPISFWAYDHELVASIGKPLRYKETDTDETFKNSVLEWFSQQEQQYRQPPHKRPVIDP